MVDEYEPFDFGFSLVDEDELEAVQNATAKAVSASSVSSELEGNLDEAKYKLDRLYQMIQPLLMNLAQDPAKEYVLWPDRAAKVQAFKEALDKVYMS